MTELQKKRQRVDALLAEAAQQKQQLQLQMHELAKASYQQIKTKKLGREAVFNLYVSSSHRAFMRFLADMGEL